ncbi:MAG: hypothetical protein ACRCTE_07505 [Cellulosilyticaceae bacterium]
MDIKTLDKSAKKGLALPTDLKGYEQAYYIASRGLYEQYARQEITLEQARAEKEHVIRAYQEGEMEWQYFMSLHQVLDKLNQLKTEGFDTVLEYEIQDILDQIL